MSPYHYWIEALAGRKPEAIVDEPQPGFYRTKRGNRWVPVAVWPKTRGLGFKIGTEVVDAQIGIEQWPHYCAHPISEEVWRAVAEKGQDWPDADPIVTEILTNGDKPKAEVDPVEDMREQISVARKGTAAYAKVESDEASARAAGLRNMLLKLSGDADKARVAEKAPHLAAEREVDKKWQPLIREADAAALELKKALDGWEDTKRDATRRAAAKAAEDARIHAEEVARAEAANRPAPPPPPPPVTNVPPPAAQIKPTYGRATNVGTKMIVTAVDYDKFFAALKTRPEWPIVKAQFDEWAQKLANKGIIPDGVTAEERANTR